MTFGTQNKSNMLIMSTMRVYDDYFRSFWTVLRDLTAILISSLMNNKRALFQF